MQTTTETIEIERAPTDRKHWNTPTEPQPKPAWTPWPQERIDQLETLEEFIAFFEEIPTEKWCQGYLVNPLGQRCARGHLGTVSTHRCPTLADQRIHQLAIDVVDHNNQSPLGPKDGTLRYLRSLLKG